MRVGLDGRILTVPRCGGATYLTRLLKYLPTVDPLLELYVFLPQPVLPDYARILSGRGIVTVTVKGPVDLSRWPAAHMPGLLGENAIDVYHQPFNADGAYFIAPCPTVVTILDLIPWVLPGTFRRPFKALRYKVRNWLWAHTSARVLTISSASRRDIVRLCRVPERKVTVTLLGADNIYDGEIPEAERLNVLERFGLVAKRYIINMGGFNQPRRNPDFILEGFARYRRESGQDVRLVVTGSVLKQDGFYDRICAKMAAEGITDRVISTGFLSNRDLKVVLTGAEISVITSLYEGFCLPLTESFACGVPAIVNNKGSVPEIAGDAAVLVDPFRPEDLAAALTRLLKDDVLRQDLKVKGLQRAKFFDWEKTARETLAVYRSAVEKRSGHAVS